MLQKRLALRALMITMTLVLAACGRGTAERESRASGGNNGQGGGGGTIGFLEKCSNGQSAYGAVTEVSNTGRSFQNLVEDLVSATLAPTDLGTVSGQAGAGTGVSVRLRLKLLDGKIQLTHSQVEILIRDSLVGQYNSQGQMIEAYPVTLEQANQGQIDSTARTFRVVFSDNYGTVTLDGQWNDSVTTGTVSFANTQHVSGGSPASGTLGQFSIPTCSIF